MTLWLDWNKLASKFKSKDRGASPMTRTMWVGGLRSSWGLNPMGVEGDDQVVTLAHSLQRRRKQHADAMQAYECQRSMVWTWKESVTRRAKWMQLVNHNEVISENMSLQMAQQRKTYLEGSQHVKIEWRFILRCHMMYHDRTLI